MRWAFTPTAEPVWLPEPLRLATCHVIRPAQVLMGALIIKWPQWEHSEDAICRAGEKRGDGQRCSSQGHKTTVHFHPLTRPAIQESNRGCINISLYGDLRVPARLENLLPALKRLTLECCTDCRGTVALTGRLCVQVLGSACLTPGPAGADITTWGNVRVCPPQRLVFLRSAAGTGAVNRGHFHKVP